MTRNTSSSACFVFSSFNDISNGLFFVLQVGYCDAGSSGEEKPTAAAAAAGVGSRSSKSKRSRGDERGTKAATRHTSSKKAKKGLGYRG